MTNFTDSAQSKQINQVEHNSDAAAKRVVLKYQDPNTGDWLNFTPNKTPGTDFDYIDGQQTSPTVDTYVYKLGGSGGTTVRTVTVTYTSSAKTDIDNVSWS